ncbi:MAG TPA: hydrolase TatD, partial [Clostridiales bacterium]|nr:hydrolase TatD [Clostridiales bacterium]
MFDTHAHYDDALFDGDREYLLKDLFGAKGVTNIITVGCDIATSQKAISLSESYEQNYAAVGLHP